MSEVRSDDVTRLLLQFDGEAQEVLDALFPLVYEELRRLAHRNLLQERPGHTMNTTGLVHEAYLNLIDQRKADWQNRAHFFAIAARAMRRILMNHARRRNADRRGAGAVPLSLDDLDVAADGRDETLLALDEALTRLEALDVRLCRVVEYRYFGGLTIEEAAAALSVSPATVKREWRTAKAWLLHALTREPPPSPEER